MTDINTSETVSGDSNEDGASAASALSLRKPPHQPSTTTDRLRLYSSLSANEAIAQLGDPDTGHARSSSATLELDSVTSGGPSTPPRPSVPLAPLCGQTSWS